MINCAGICRIAAILLLAISPHVSAVESIAYGPVEQIDPDGNALTVLGQRFVITDNTRVLGFHAQEAGDRKAIAATLQSDEPLLVIGTNLANGTFVATELRRSGARYVAGASEVIVAGKIESVQPATGTFFIQGAKIYASDIVNLPSEIFAGLEVTVVGRQATPRDAIWATEIAVGVRPLKERIDSITGTGVQSQSITGTGIQSQSITGTGISQQSITGTGVRAESITGTGIQSQSITGTGIQSQSITGTGISQQSITGTGVHTQSITGTGIQSQSITGTGIQAQSITGTGISQQSITGTGRL